MSSLNRQGSMLGKPKPVNALRVTQSTLEAEFAARPDLQAYADRLMAMDTDHNGEIGLDEVLEAVAAQVKVEREKKTLKRLLAAMALLNLLTVAATVGLTYAVVALSKDTSVESAVFIDKSTGAPMMVGVPSVELEYDSTTAPALVDVFDNTTVMDVSGSSRRRLLAADDWCALPRLDALAVMPVDHVRQRCLHISKAGNSAQFQLRVARRSKGADCSSIDGRGGKAKACATYRDAVSVTDDDCNLMFRTLSCSAVGQKYRVGVIWADSTVQMRRHTSYYISCLGTCTAGKNGGEKASVQFSHCGVARAQCAEGNGGAAAGRRLMGEEEGVVTLSVHGTEMDCSSGVCLAA